MDLLNGDIVHRGFGFCEFLDTAMALRRARGARLAASIILTMW
jgi:hypothetical protein